MLYDIKKTIDEIYINNNTDIFILGCKKNIIFLNELIDIIKKNCLTVNVYTNDNEPAVEIRFIVNKVLAKNIEIEYITILNINKIVNYYYIQHEFSLENPDPDGMDAYLDSFKEEAYSKKQFNTSEIICNYLNQKGYVRLSYNDMEEVCLGINKFKDNDNGQMTVKNALFMDLWNICSNKN
ncbi:MAG: hypothetical protein MRZ25_05795 [Ruminococcus sp.]|nr:hypothetical protein [Ruminococcus sp.]